jgi:DNA-binding transcriptional ArsR family regulator
MMKAVRCQIAAGRCAALRAGDEFMSKDITRRQALEALAAAYLVSSASQAALAAPANAGEYAGALKTLPGGCIVLSSDGQHVLVYFCDGTDMHPATVSHWMRGEFVSDAVRIASGGFTLVAQLQLQGQRVTGTLTLPNGTALPFVAHNHWPDGSQWGAYRSEAQFNGVTYIGGWIAKPSQHAEAPLSGGVQPVSLAAPAVADPAIAGPVERAAIEDDVDDDWPHTGGGVINQQTGAVLPYAAPNLATMTAEVPGLGVFRLHRCTQAKCT